MKTFYTQNNIGKAKYTISYHDGISKHNDGSNFFGIAIFSNKKKFEERKNQMLNDGYTQTN
jgi:hypothetical protein